jgi:hypothetical protein
LQTLRPQIGEYVKAYCEGQVAERISPEHENYRGRVSDCTHVIETDGLIS